MKVDLDNLNPGIWFYFYEDKSEEGRIKLRVMNAEIRSKIANETTKIDVEYKGNNRFETEKVDREEASKMMWDYVIVDWENLLNDDGNEIECNAENKYKLMNELPNFAAFVAECLDKINEDIFERKEFSEKNS